MPPMTSDVMQVDEAPRPLFGSAGRSNAITDMGLVLPIFVAYHLGVVLLRVRNAADPVTARLVRLAEGQIALYWLATFGIGVALAAFLLVASRGESFDKRRFVLVALEGVLYAMVMRTVAGYAVGSLAMAKGVALTPWQGVVMACGAGLYEELAFRVCLFGGGAFLIRMVFGSATGALVILGWAVFCAAGFSAWHHVGPFADPFVLSTFVFRTTCALVLTSIYVFRGLAAAVWTHALYDVWALSLS
jgi:hypothetical protein